MNAATLKAWALLWLSFILFGCGGGGGESNLSDFVATNPGDDVPANSVRLDLASDNYLLNIERAESATLTIFTRNAENAAFAGVEVNLTATGGTLSSDTVTTDTTGTATVKFYSAPETESQVVTITAETGNQSKVLAITLATTDDTTDAERLDITTDHYTLNADGSEQAKLTIYARDSSNAALGGVDVYLSATAGFLSTSSVTTDASGKASLTFSPGPDNINQVATIVATSGSLSQSIAITMVVPPILGATKLSIDTNKPQLSTNQNDFATITIYTLDADNAPVGDVLVNLSATAGYLSTAKVTTNATGTATVTFTPGAEMVNQLATITASSDTLSASLGIFLVGDSDPPCQIILTSDLSPGTLLSQGSQTTISASVLDRNDSSVEDGTLVSFEINPQTAGSINPEGETVNGVATATFQAGTAGGPVTVTGSVLGRTCNTDPDGILSGDLLVISDDISFEIAPSASSAITFVSAEPETVGVRSSGRTESTTLTFQVLDSGGGPVADGTPVEFAIATPLGGGESLSTEQATTVSGYVKVALQSGTVAGAVAVRASVEDSNPLITTTGKVIVIAGLADSNHFSLATSRLNLPGYSCFGEAAQITSFVADRYANPVPSGTPVYYTSEAGAMVMDSTNMEPAFTNGYGQAAALHVTQLPYPDTTSVVTGVPGISTILAWTQGQEAFIDENGNGIYDVGEPFDDFGEPFIDANDNGAYALSERYVDSNANGKYDGPNGVWDDDTFVWNTIGVLWSSFDITLSITPGLGCPGYVIPEGQSCEITIEVVDNNTNPIVGGSTISINPPNPTLLPYQYHIYPNLDESPEFIIPDANYSGLDTTIFKFVVRNNLGGEEGSLGMVIDLNVPGFCTSDFQLTRTISVTLEAPTP